MMIHDGDSPDLFIPSISSYDWGKHPTCVFRILNLMLDNSEDIYLIYPKRKHKKNRLSWCNYPMTIPWRYPHDIPMTLSQENTTILRCHERLRGMAETIAFLGVARIQDQALVHWLKQRWKLWHWPRKWEYLRMYMIILYTSIYCSNLIYIYIHNIYICIHN
jgi:hypothetical protein